MRQKIYRPALDLVEYAVALGCAPFRVRHEGKDYRFRSAKKLREWAATLTSIQGYALSISGTERPKEKRIREEIKRFGRTVRQGMNRQLDDMIVRAFS